MGYFIPYPDERFAALQAGIDSDVAALQAGIATNAADIATNAADIATNATDITTLFARTPRPQMALNVIEPVPAGLVVPAGGFLDLPIFALSVDDRAGVTILSSGAIFQLEGELVNPPGSSTVRILGSLDFRLRDATGIGGNVEWTMDAITGLDLGSPAEIVFENSFFFDAVSSNLRIMQFGSVELFVIPSLPLVQFALRASHDSGTDRTIDVLSVTVAFLQQQTS